MALQEEAAAAALWLVAPITPHPTIIISTAAVVPELLGRPTIQQKRRGFAPTPPDALDSDRPLPAPPATRFAVRSSSQHRQRAEDQKGATLAPFLAEPSVSVEIVFSATLPRHAERP